jgi:hypothetical protein
MSPASPPPADRPDSPAAVLVPATPEGAAAHAPLVVEGATPSEEAAPEPLFIPLSLRSQTPDADEIQALEQLGEMRGANERRAAVLSLILTPHSGREAQAWREETAGMSNARAVHALVRKLSPAARLPAMERALGGLVDTQAPERKQLLASARRVMAADGQFRPLDRLHWLVMRHLLSDRQASSPPMAPPAADSENRVSQLPESQRAEIASFTAFLARLVPAADASHAVSRAGAEWHRAVVARWWPPGQHPACTVPDADGLVHALWGVQDLSWMLRPTLARTWVNEALGMSEPQSLNAEAADALRMACVLLDTPLPPELSRSFIECAA